MDNVPPKALKSELVHLDNGLKQIERKQHAGIQRAPGSLPVLEAFQEFLENERRKARKKMIALTAVFASLLVVIGAAVGVTIYLQMKRMAVDYDSVTQRTSDLESQLAAAEAAAATSLSAIGERLETETEATRKLHGTLQADHSAVATQVEAERLRVTKMQGALVRLAGENRALKEDLDRIMNDWPSVTEQVEALVASTRDEPETPTEEPVADTETAPAETAGPRVVAPPTVYALRIVPPGEEHGIRWRLPSVSIPE